MWIRRSDIEIDKFHLDRERKRKSLIRPAFWAVICTSFITGLYSFGYRGSLRGFVAFGQQAVPSRQMIALWLIGFAIAFAVIYIRQLRGATIFDETPDALLCLNCDGPAKLEADGRCECGFVVEPYEYYEWQEDLSHELTSTTGNGLAA